MESKVCVFGSTHIYSIEVCALGDSWLDTSEVMQPGEASQAPAEVTVSPPLSPTLEMSFNVGKRGHSRPAERFNEPH